MYLLIAQFDHLSFAMTDEEESNPQAIIIVSSDKAINLQIAGNKVIKH